MAAKLDPAVVEILDGGSHHYNIKDQPKDMLGPNRPGGAESAGGSKKQNVDWTAAMASRLEISLAAALPHARILRPAAASVDMDFFRMVHAPLLLTGAGSFAASAASAALGREVWTPASQNLNFPHLGQRKPERLAENWQTYTYAMENTSGLEASNSQSAQRVRKRSRAA